MYSWLADLLTRLSVNPVCGYVSGQPPAAEPTATVAAALWGHGHIAPARAALRWLAEQQDSAGAVANRPELERPSAHPGWTTSLAVLAWKLAEDGEFHAAIDRAVDWLLTHRGTSGPRPPELGHDTALVGWPWADNTHSWLEPTAFARVALIRAGWGSHPRVDEARRLLLDRQLPDGGCNYGNTLVLGQALLPHVHSTGIALWALADSPLEGRLEKSAAYVERSLDGDTAAASLSWGLLGLAAHRRAPTDADPWLERAARRPTTLRAPLRQALLALAFLGAAGPWMLPSARPTAVSQQPLASSR